MGLKLHLSPRYLCCFHLIAESGTSTKLPSEFNGFYYLSYHSSPISCKGLCLVSVQRKVSMGNTLKTLPFGLLSYPLPPYGITSGGSSIVLSYNCLFMCLSHSGLTPQKQSRGKPALARVPFLDGVNGDLEFSSTGKKLCVCVCVCNANCAILINF